MEIFDFKDKFLSTKIKCEYKQYDGSPRAGVKRSLGITNTSFKLGDFNGEVILVSIIGFVRVDRARHSCINCNSQLNDDSGFH